MAIITHIPHSSTVIPEEGLASYRVSREELDEITRYLSDLRTDEFFDLGMEEWPIVVPWARTYLDVERFLEGEAMEALGMGAIYEKTPDGRVLREVSSEEREYLLGLYWKHQKKVASACEESIHQEDWLLLVDCHSYPLEPFPWENAELRRPEFCIGHNGDVLGVKAAQIVQASLEKKGFYVALNEPFSHSFEPHGMRASSCWTSVMIEVRRDLIADRFDEAHKAVCDAVSSAHGIMGDGVVPPFSDVELPKVEDLF